MLVTSMPSSATEGPAVRLGPSLPERCQSLAFSQKHNGTLSACVVSRRSANHL